MEKDKLVEKMKVLLGTVFAFYLKAHGFHWNVEGENFKEYHALFGDLYEEVWGSVDDIAEHIRAIDAYAPASLGRYYQLSTVKDEANIPTAMQMVKILLADNDKVLEALKDAYDAAEAAGEIGLSNFIQDRTDIHKKHGWMLRATTKV